MLISTSMPRAASSAPWPMTQRSMSRIAPYFSAAGRKSPGGMRLPSVARIRISSSRWTVAPVARSTIGCDVQLEPVLGERAADLSESGDLAQLRVELRLARLALGDVDHLAEQHVDRAVGLANGDDADRRPRPRRRRDARSASRSRPGRAPRSPVGQALGHHRELVGVADLHERQRGELLPCITTTRRSASTTMTAAPGIRPRSVSAKPAASLRFPGLINVDTSSPTRRDDASPCAREISDRRRSWTSGCARARRASRGTSPSHRR